jgi:hypothetical protein
MEKVLKKRNKLSFGVEKIKDENERKFIPKPNPNSYFAILYIDKYGN